VIDALVPQASPQAPQETSLFVDWRRVSIPKTMTSVSADPIRDGGSGGRREEVAADLLCTGVD
jgi:hypothetical protein